MGEDYTRRYNLLLLYLRGLVPSLPPVKEPLLEYQPPYLQRRN